MLRRLPRSVIAELAQWSENHISSEQRDEMAIPSHTHRNPLIRWLMWRRCEVIHALANLGESEAVLEFGCGMGLFLPALADTAGKVWAVDLFPQCAQRLSEMLNLEVAFVANLSEIPDASLDAVVAADVMEHLESPREYATEFRRTLRPGGRLLVSGPTENLAYKIGRIAAGFADKGGYHHTDIDQLRADITASGFTLEATRRLPFLFPCLFKVFRFRKSAD